MSDTAKVSAELRLAIAEDAIGCVSDTQRLGREDVATLHRVLAGREKPDFAVSRKRALGALARSDPSPETAEVLARVLLDGKAAARDRNVAAAYAGLLPTKLAEPTLLAALERSTGPLRTELIKALGEAGGSAALDRLRALARAAPADRALKLAILTIGMREGQSTDGLFEALDVDWTSLKAERLEAREVAQTIAAVHGSSYGIRLSEETAIGFSCGGIRHVLLLNADIPQGSFITSTLFRPALAGLVVMETDSERQRQLSYDVRWLLLTEPRGDGIRLAVVRPSGDPVFTGEGAPDTSEIDVDGTGKGYPSRGLILRLRDTGLERTPVEIEGRLTEETIDLRVRTWAGPLRRKQSPRPLAMQMPQPARREEQRPAPR